MFRNDPCPKARARSLGVYRFWCDVGFVVGALLAGIATDVSSAETAIVVGAVVTAASGLVVAATPWQRPAPVAAVQIR